jgi:RimJ/RimL family protein N-acetyltransferase
MPSEKVEDVRLTQPNLWDAFFMWKTFQEKDFTEGLQYKAPLSLFFCIQDTRTKPNGKSYSVRSGKKIVGRIWHKKKENECHIGYWIGPQFQSQGFATEAIRNILTKLSDTPEVVAYCHSWNQASQKALLANGFIQEGNKGNLQRYIFRTI